jgi:VanZ family protein
MSSVSAERLVRGLRWFSWPWATGIYAALLTVALLVPADTEWHAHRQEVYLSIGADLTWGEVAADAVPNVAIFIAFGVLLGGVLHRRAVGPHRRVLVVAATLGVYALVIESLQYVLGWRDSSLLDVLSNIAGAVTGAWLECAVTRAPALALRPRWHHAGRSVMMTSSN